MIRVKMGLFFKSIWHGMLGIAAEILTVLIFIAAGFLVCLLWWSFSG